MNFLQIFMLLNTPKIISNIENPTCKNCVHYKPSLTNIDFVSQFNKCEKFGEKNVMNGKIKYDFAIVARNDENKCGLSGKYFEQDPNINIKILKHFVIAKLPPFLFYSFFGYIFIMSILVGIIKPVK